MIVNLNPGGPNGGSATQYFIGDFNGHKFSPFTTDTRWLDYGPDEYAGVTYSNTGNRRVFLGWMSNWQYGQQVPTKEWRSAMTIPRELSVKKENKNYLISSLPVKEMDKLSAKEFKLQNVDASHFNLTSKSGKLKGPAELKIVSDKLEDFSITLSNSADQKLVIGYDRTSNSYFIDRTRSGKVDFEKGFAAKHTAPRLVATPKFNLIVVIDNASVELFADDGLTVMTEIFFPDSNFSDVIIESEHRFQLNNLQLITLRSVYK